MSTLFKAPVSVCGVYSLPPQPNSLRRRSPSGPNGDLLDGVPAISPLAWNLSYRFPAHCLSAEFQPQAPDPEPTHLVLYRNRRKRIEFLKINRVTQRLFVLPREHKDRTGRDLLNTIALELQHPRPTELIETGRSMLDALRERQILLGTRRL